MSRKISCEVRCLEPDTVRAARDALEGASVGTVPFVCKVSGKREQILLLGCDAAERLAKSNPSIGGALSQKIAAALLNAELCECDIATVTESEESRVLDELDRLRCAGVVQVRDIQSMKYYSLASSEAREQLKQRMSELGPG